MRQYYIASRILLILPIIDFAVAAPLLVQEKRHAPVDMELISKDAITMLGKRGGELDELSKLMLTYDIYLAKPDLVHEDHFAKPEESSATRPSPSSPPSGPDDEWTDVRQPPPSTSIPEEPPIESDYGLTGVHAPLSSPVFPSWFHPGSIHAPQPETDSDHMLVAGEPPSRPPSPTVLDADHEYQMVHPQTQSDHEMPEMVDVAPSGPVSSTVLDADADHEYEMVDVAPSGPVSSTNPDRRSMGTDSRLEDLQAVSDVLNGNAKESRRISGTARGVLNAA